jgi:hypothetical protein
MRAQCGSKESTAKSMKRKHLLLAISALLAAGGLWLATAAWRADVVHKSGTGVGVKTPSDRSKPGEMLNPPARLAPPNPNRRFQDLTPEERVQRARRGPIGG